MAIHLLFIFIGFGNLAISPHRHEVSAIPTQEHVGELGQVLPALTPLLEDLRDDREEIQNR